MVTTTSLRPMFLTAEAQARAGAVPRRPEALDLRVLGQQVLAGRCAVFDRVHVVVPDNLDVRVLGLEGVQRAAHRSSVWKTWMPQRRTPTLPLPPISSAMHLGRDRAVGVVVGGAQTDVVLARHEPGRLGVDQDQLDARSAGSS